ncbi:MAG TPA: hypothetical protein VJZ27_20465, partial [Aggregatilineales bacterium]|nr:hypothetical protein [Aggregatilineales bacterium]
MTTDDQTDNSRTQEFHDSIDSEKLEAEARGWYEKWRGRIRDWVSDKVDPSLAELVLLVPD